MCLFAKWPMSELLFATTTTTCIQLCTASKMHALPHAIHSVRMGCVLNKLARAWVNNIITKRRATERESVSHILSNLANIAP